MYIKLYLHDILYAVLANARNFSTSRGGLIQHLSILAAASANNDLLNDRCKKQQKNY